MRGWRGGLTGSPRFARIKADVLRMVAAVPEGRVASHADAGGHLDVMPRRVGVAALPHGVPQRSRPADAPVRGGRRPRA